MNLKAGRLIKSLGISIAVTENQFDVLRDNENRLVGFADYYLTKCWNASEFTNKANVAVYKQLLVIDSKLGTSQTEQLFFCLYNSLRKDIMKVSINF